MYHSVQKWENALLEHISYRLNLGGRVIDDDKDDDVLPLGCLQDSLRVGFYRALLCNIVNVFEWLTDIFAISCHSCMSDREMYGVTATKRPEMSMIRHAVFTSALKHAIVIIV